jgi:hypothetical protein
MLTIFKDLVIPALSAGAVPALLTFAVHIPIGAVPAEFPFTETGAHPGVMVDPPSSGPLSLVYPSPAILAVDKVFGVDFPS